MEFLLSFLLLSLNLLDYEIGINKILFLIISTVLVAGLFYIVYRKNRDFLCTCVVLLCHVWPISWINVFGDPTERLQLPWFYVIGAMIMLYAVFNIAKLKDNKVSAVVLGIFATLLIVSVYPLIISPSKSEGLKEFVTIGFFIILVFVAFLQTSSFDEKKRRAVISAYIFTVFISSLFIILQSVLYMVAGEPIFKYSVGNYFGNVMISAKLLMEDTSCSTIMLGSAVFYMLERFNNKEKRILHIIMILSTVIALAFTTRRTSIVSLAVILVLYVMFYYKGTMKKITMFAFIAAVVGVMAFYLLITRPVDDYSQYFNANGRIENYLNSLKIVVSNPLGIGYDNVYLEKLMDGIVPHNTVLRWINMGGFIFAILMVSVLVYVVYCAHSKGRKDDFWVLVYCLFAMNFIPDLLNARFFVIPCMITMLSVSVKIKERTKEERMSEI